MGLKDLVMNADETLLLKEFNEALGAVNEEQDSELASLIEKAATHIPNLTVGEFQEMVTEAFELGEDGYEMVTLQDIIEDRAYPPEEG